MRWIIGIGVGLVVVVGVTWLAGLALPQGHRASRTVNLAAEPATVFAAISDFARYPDWRSDVKKIEVEGGPGQGALVREHNTSGTIPYRVEVLSPPSRMVMRIADPSLPFGGTWTYELRAEGCGDIADAHRRRRSLQPDLPRHAEAVLLALQDDRYVSGELEEAPPIMTQASHTETTGRHGITE